MIRRHNPWFLFSMVLLAGTATFAKKPDNSGGGDVNVQSAYKIVPLPSPEGGNGHYGVVSSISDPGVHGEVYVVGWHYHHPTDDDLAYCWTVDPDGSVEIEDLSDWFWNHDLDVNCAGVVCGGTNEDFADRSPAVLFPDGTFVVFEEEFTLLRLNNPNDEGVFQVIGRHFLWDIDIHGNVLGQAALVDGNGTELLAYDINDVQEIAGFVHEDNDPDKEQIPAIGKFVNGKLQISTRTNPNPGVIFGFWDIQVDNAGNLLGFGVSSGESIGVRPRAVIWPATGGAIDLVSEFPYLNTAHGNGIAKVDGKMQVVGDAYANSGTFPSLYINGELHDLNQLSQGDEPWELRGAAAINRSGVISGHGTVGRRRDARASACLLIPTK